MKYQIPLSPHPPLHQGPTPDEAEIRARTKSIEENQQQEVISRIFQQARSNISHSSSIIPTTTTTTPNSNPTCNTGTIIDPHLNFKYPIKTKDGGPLLDPKPPEPGPIYTPKDLSESIANGGKQDAAYYIFEAVQGCQTKARNASAREKEFRVGGETNIGEGDGRMPVALRREAERMLEEQKRVQRNTLDVARDPRLQRR